MNNQPPSEQNFEKTVPDQDIEVLSSPSQEQFLNLKIEVEKLYSKVNGLSGLLQTLVSGLVIAIAIAIGIAGWFAYHLLVQEQIAQRDAEQAAAAESEMLEQIVQLEEQLQRQEEQLQRFKEQVPEEITVLTDSIEANQRQLELLRERLPKAEPDESSQENSD